MCVVIRVHGRVYWLSVRFYSPVCESLVQLRSEHHLVVRYLETKNRESVLIARLKGVHLEVTTPVEWCVWVWECECRGEVCWLFCEIHPTAYKRRVVALSIGDIIPLQWDPHRAYMGDGLLPCADGFVAAARLWHRLTICRLRVWG